MTLGIFTILVFAFVSICLIIHCAALHDQRRERDEALKTVGRRLEEAIKKLGEHKAKRIAMGVALSDAEHACRRGDADALVAGLAEASRIARGDTVSEGITTSPSPPQGTP